VTPVGQITLTVTFGTQENFCTEHMQFEVVDLDTTYNAFLRRSVLSKFMEIPHYAYLVLKMTGSHGVISVRGDNKHTYDYDRESYKAGDKFTASVELQELKKALVEFPLPHPPSSDPIMLEAKTSKTSFQPEDSLSKMVLLSSDEPARVAHVGNSLDPK
jgi:hypothetical protein